VPPDDPPHKAKNPAVRPKDDPLRQKLDDSALSAHLVAFGLRRTRDPDVARDLAQQAIILTLSGQRPWDPAKHPDILKRLRGILRNLAGKYFVRAAREVPASAFERDDLDDDDETAASPIDRAVDPAGDPESLMIERESPSIAARRWELLCKELEARDPMALRVLHERARSGKTKAQIAADFGVSEQEMEAVYQRIRHWADRVREKVKNR
jgi:DNA-directed RNA polymerase specialized sigma24 family protein